MDGLVEESGRKRGIGTPIQMTVCTSGGKRLWAFRYSSEHDSRSLFFSTRLDVLREQHPEISELALLSDESRLIVSEPLGDLEGAWNPVPESSWGVVQDAQDEIHPFPPHNP